MRTLRSFQGVVTAAATVSAPARASRPAVASLSATCNAMRTGPETHLRVALAPVSELREAKSVAVERHRRLEVRDGEHQPKLLDVAHPPADVTLLRPGCPTWG